MKGEWNVHSSYAAQHPEHTCNEQLEFFGDAILQMYVTMHLLEKFPTEREGFLTSRRSQLVSNQALSRAFPEELRQLIRLGPGVSLTPKIVAGCFEAYVCHLWRLRDEEALWKFLQKTLFSKHVSPPPQSSDALNALMQTYAKGASLSYAFEQGRWRAQITWKSNTVSATAPTKKKARHDAAKKAMLRWFRCQI